VPGGGSITYVHEIFRVPPFTDRLIPVVDTVPVKDANQWRLLS